MIPLAVLCAALLALLAYREWRSQKFADKLISFAENTAKQATEERRQLVTQIQTPEVAPFLDVAPAPPPISTDEDYWEEKQELLNGGT